MAITFACECGKPLRAGEELVGKKTRCPHCSAIVQIPRAEADDELIPPEPDGSYQLHDDDARLRPSSPPAVRPPASKPVVPKKTGTEAGGGASLLEYSYLLLGLALIPLMFSLLGKEAKSDLQDRLARTIAQASPEEQKRIENVFSREVSLDEALAALPGGKLAGAHLSRDSSAHWAYAAIAAVGFLLLLGLLFSVERAQAAHLLGIGAFTGTVGIVLLLLIQFCSNFRLRGIRGRGVVMIILLILTFIGWSYDSANDPESNFFLSALGFTFGVGLCEEFTKAIPLFFYFKRDARMGWRVACLWGLASGIGFGVSEGSCTHHGTTTGWAGSTFTWSVSSPASRSTRCGPGRSGSRSPGTWTPTRRLATPPASASSCSGWWPSRWPSTASTTRS